MLLAFERADQEPDPERRQQLMTFVVVGAGATGVELAGALSGIARQTLVGDYRNIRPESARVVLVEGGPHVLPVFPADLQTKARQALIDLGVDVLTDTMVTSIEPGLVRTKTGSIQAATILWAAGVRASSLGRTMGGVALDRVGRVVVTPELQVPGHPEVYVIGDLSAATFEGRPLPGLAAVAQQEGRHVARQLRRAFQGLPATPFRYRNQGNLATIGRSHGVAEIGQWHFDGSSAWFVWLAVHLFKLVGFRNRLFVLVEWIWYYVTFNRGARLITGSTRLASDASADAAAPLRVASSR